MLAVGSLLPHTSSSSGLGEVPGQLTDRPPARALLCFAATFPSCALGPLTSLQKSILLSSFCLRQILNQNEYLAMVLISFKKMLSCLFLFSRAANHLVSLQALLRAAEVQNRAIRDCF